LKSRSRDTLLRSTNFNLTSGGALGRDFKKNSSNSGCTPLGPYAGIRRGVLTFVAAARLTSVKVRELAE
jgi:hypothetical protein